MMVPLIPMMLLYKENVTEYTWKETVHTVLSTLCLPALHVVLYSS